MPPGKSGKSRKRKSSGKHDKHGGRVRQLRQAQRRGAATVASTAERRSSCGKYSREAQQLWQVRWAGAVTASCVPRFISTYRSPCPIYPSMKACSFFGCLPGCQSFMIYFITLQGTFPQKNGVLIKILLRTRNNNRIIEINSTRKARKSIYPSSDKA